MDQITQMVLDLWITATPAQFAQVAIAIVLVGWFVSRLYSK